MNINRIDCIDNRVATQVLELDLSHNKITSLINIEQFTSLNKLKISFNQIESVKELGYLKGIEQLEQISLEGNPF